MKLLKPQTEERCAKPAEGFKADGEHQPGSTRLLVPAIYGLFILSILYTLYFAKEFLVPICIALFLTFITKPIFRFLHRLKIPSLLAGGLVILFLVTLFAGAVLQLTEPAKNWMTRMPESLRQLEYTVTHYHPAEQVTQTVQEVREIADPDGGGKSQKIQVQTRSLSDVFLGWTTNFVASIFVVFFLLFFFSCLWRLLDTPGRNPFVAGR